MSLLVLREIQLYYISNIKISTKIMRIHGNNVKLFTINTQLFGINGFVLFVTCYFKSQVVCDREDPGTQTADFVTLS